MKCKGGLGGKGVEAYREGAEVEWGPRVQTKKGGEGRCGGKVGKEGPAKDEAWWAIQQETNAASQGEGPV